MDKAMTLGFGHARRQDGRAVIREGTIRKETAVRVYAPTDTVCPCERARLYGYGMLCNGDCTPHGIDTVDHTDGDF